MEIEEFEEQEEVEEEKEKQMPLNQSIKNLINELYGPHLDNARLQYYAKDHQGRRFSIMPHTPFVYEYFLFNSLYQVDWINTYKNNELIFHLRTSNENKFYESDAIKEFIFGYLRDQTKSHPDYIYRSFEPLLYIDTKGEWTQVTPDERISIEKGKNFFKHINKIKEILEHCQKPCDMPTSSKKIFDPIKECAIFIYLVRNNIFHGAKTLGEIYEINQRKRIEIYDIFLKCITSLFFLVSGKEKAACDFVPCPIYARSLPNGRSNQFMNRDLLFNGIATKMMKTSDSRLVAQFIKYFPVNNTSNYLSEKSSLFYPSAGIDFITPILLGLPYCTNFYFFEWKYDDHLRQTNTRRRNNNSPLLYLRNFLSKIIHSKRLTDFSYSVHNTTEYLDFEYDGIPRRVHWVHADNKEIFTMNIELNFYFHRGDSPGEGGSGQHWDSKYIDKLREFIPSHTSALFITDGHPGNFKTDSASEMYNLTVPYIDAHGRFEPLRNYCCGRLSSLKGV